MYIDFKRLGKKVLRILACVISAFLLLWGGATLYLKITQNYNAVSPADCVARERLAWHDHALRRYAGGDSLDGYI